MASDTSIRSSVKTIYLTPSAENLLSYFQKEVTTQLINQTTKDQASLSLPNTFNLATMVVHQTQPLITKEEIQTIEAQRISVNESAFVDAPTAISSFNG